MWYSTHYHNSVQRFLTWGSTSHPWYRGMSRRSNTMHSGVYSKTRTPVNLTLTSRPVWSLWRTAIASLMFWGQKTSGHSETQPSSREALGHHREPPVTQRQNPLEVRLLVTTKNIQSLRDPTLQQVGSWSPQRTSSHSETEPSSSGALGHQREPPVTRRRNSPAVGLLVTMTEAERLVTLSTAFVSLNNCVWVCE